MSYIGNQGIAICPDPLWPVPHHLNSAKLMADDICCSQLMGLCCQTAKHAYNISWIYGGYICLGGFLILCWRSLAVSGCVLNHFNPKNTRDRTSIYLSIYLFIRMFHTMHIKKRVYGRDPSSSYPAAPDLCGSSNPPRHIISPYESKLLKFVDLTPIFFTFNVVLNDTCL
jgi:hypothetical protein